MTSAEYRNQSESFVTQIGFFTGLGLVAGTIAAIVFGYGAIFGAVSGGVLGAILALIVERR